MGKEVLSRALDPFFTTKCVGPGTGLGWSMVYGFVTQSGGQLLINSTPGNGTRVELYFPAAADTDAGDAQPAPAMPYSTAPRHEVVLVVEDDPNVRELCLRTLHAIGYRALDADCGPAKWCTCLATRPISSAMKRRPRCRPGLPSRLPLPSWPTRSRRHSRRAPPPREYRVQSSGLRFAKISSRFGSRNGASTTFSPSVAGSSSTAKPGPSDASSKRMPFGSRKYRLRNQ